MRIVIALHQFFPEFCAGTEVLALQVAVGLRRRGHEVLIFAGTPAAGAVADDERFQWSDYDGFQVLKFQHQHRPMAGETDLVRQEFDSTIVRHRFSRLLREWKPDRVHFFNFARISSSPADCCRELGIPFFYTATDFWSICLTARLQLEDGRVCTGPSLEAENCVAHLLEIKVPVARRLVSAVPGIISLAQRAGQRFPLNRITSFHMLDSMRLRLDVIRRRLDSAVCIWVPTQTMADALQAFGVGVGRLRRQPYGVDLNGVKRRVRQRELTMRFAFIGTIAFHKGLHTIVDAFALCSRPDLSLRIYGDTSLSPDYFAGLAGRIADDARISVMGCFSPEKIDDVFEDIDALIVPSVWTENAPLVMLEALARGCPVVVSNQAGLIEFVSHEVNGLIFDAGNSLALASSLERLLTEEGLIEGLSRACAAPMSIDDYVGDIDSAYASCLSH